MDQLRAAGTTLEDDGPHPRPGRRGSEFRPAPEPIRWTLPGFCEPARIATSFGELPIQALRRRDPLRTADGALATVDWVDRIMLDEEFINANPDALPVRISAGAFGAGRPKVDLLVSPTQPLNVSNSDFGRDFRPARELVDRPGIMRNPQLMVTYYLFRCINPAIVKVEGIGVPTS